MKLARHIIIFSLLLLLQACQSRGGYKLTSLQQAAQHASEWWAFPYVCIVAFCIAFVVIVPRVIKWLDNN